MTFRTPAEAVELANNTRYGLAASVWTENINLALDIAPQLKAGTVWINCTNLFDAASGLRRLPRERLRPRRRARGAAGVREAWEARAVGRSGESERSAGQTIAASAECAARSRSASDSDRPTDRPTARPPARLPAIDRTPKLYIGGKQARPDSGYSLPVLGAAGARIGEVGAGQPQGHPQRRRGGAHSRRAGVGRPAHNRAQVLYYLAENLAARADEFGRRLAAGWPAMPPAAEREVERAIERTVHLRGLGGQV